MGHPTPFTTRLCGPLHWMPPLRLSFRLNVRNTANRFCLCTAASSFDPAAAEFSWNLSACMSSPKFIFVTYCDLSRQCRGRLCTLHAPFTHVTLAVRAVCCLPLRLLTFIKPANHYRPHAHVCSRIVVVATPCQCALALHALYRVILAVNQYYVRNP